MSGDPREHGWSQPPSEGQPAVPMPGHGPWPQQGPYGPPPRAPKRSYWGCLLIGLGLMALLGVGIAGCTLFVVNIARGPIDAANAWVALLDEGDFDTAYDSLCSEQRAANDRQAIVGELESTFGAGISDYSLVRVETVSGFTTVEGTIEVNGRATPVTLEMHNDDGNWKVCSIPR